MVAAISFPTPKLGDTEKKLEALLLRHEANKKTLAMLQQKVAEQQAKILFKQKKVGQEKEQNQVLASSINSERTELSKILDTKKKMSSVFDQIKGLMACNACKKFTVLPLVAGPCGHIICQGCVERIDDVAKKEMEKKEQVDFHSTRKCIACLKPILGKGTPVLPLKAIGTILGAEGSEIDQKLVGASYDLHMGKGNLEHALGIATWTTAEIAKVAALKIIEKTATLAWNKIDINFVECNELFYDTFILILKEQKEISLLKQKSFAHIQIVKQKPPELAVNTLTVHVRSDGHYEIEKPKPLN